MADFLFQALQRCAVEVWQLDFALYLRAQGVHGPARLAQAAPEGARCHRQALRAMHALRTQVEREIELPNLDSAPLQRLEQEIRQGISLNTEPANDAATVALPKENAS